jgi:iron-sulfur cluster repair protein YtfE (RIC family)
MQVTLTNVLESMRRDHHALSELLERVRATSERARKARSELLSKMRAAFEVHATAEEEVVYPALRELARTCDPRLARRILAATEEHDLLRRLFDDLAQVDPGDPRWIARLDLLRENILHHVAEEEGELFPLVRRLLGREGRRELARRVDDAERRLHGRRHDLAPARSRSFRRRVASLWV